MNILFAVVAVFAFGSGSPNMSAGQNDAPNTLTVASERWEEVVCAEKLDELEGARSAIKEMTAAKDQGGSWTTANEDELTKIESEADAMEYDLEQHC